MPVPHIPASLQTSQTASLGTDGTTITDSATSVLGAIGCNNADNAFSSSSVVANADGSVLERQEYIQTALGASVLALPRYATKTSTSPLTTGTLFTWAGTILIDLIVGRVTTAIQNQSTTVKLSITPDALSAYDICATKDIQAFAVGSLISITGTAANAALSTTAVGTLAPIQDGKIGATCVTSGTITVTFGAASTGAIAWEILWRPVNAAAAVTAA